MVFFSVVVIFQSDVSVIGFLYIRTKDNKLRCAGVFVKRACALRHI
jgi:hypothetical protein